VPITFEISGANVRRRFLFAFFVFEESVTADSLVETCGDVIVLVGRHIVSIVGVQVVVALVRK
jgi:hypothetical protein